MNYSLTRLKSVGKLLVACSLLLALGTVANASDSPSATEVVAASIAASGGDALDGIASVRRQATMHLEGDMFGSLEGNWTIAYQPGKRGFQTTQFSGAKTEIGWNGERGWEESPMGTQELDSNGIWLNRWLWEINLLHAIERDGSHRLERLADTALGGVMHYVIEAVDEHGLATQIYVEPSTSLISRLATQIEMGPLGLSAVTQDFADYAEVSGVKLPQTFRQTIEGLWSYEAKFSRTEFGVDLDDEMFERSR